MTKPLKDLEIQLISLQPSKPAPKQQRKVYDIIYNPEIIPPNFTLATNHAKAFRFYRTKPTQDDQDDSEICPCCRLPINGELVPLTCSPEIFSHTGTYHLGPGYALYFYFLKLCGTLLILLFAMSGSFNLFTDLHKGNCDQNFCDQSFATFLSLAKKRDSSGLLNFQLYLNLFAMVFMMFFFQYTRYYLRKVAVKIKENTPSASNYTLKLTRVPSRLTNEEIKNWFEALSSTKYEIKCIKVVRTYDIKELFSLEMKKEDLAMKYNNKKGKAQQVILREKLSKIKQEIQVKLQSKEQQLTPSVFVTFETPFMASFLLRMLKPKSMRSYLRRLNPFSPQLLLMKNHRINIKKASDPSDVLWENLNHSSFAKLKDRIVTNFFALLVLGAGFSLVLLISLGKRYLKMHFDQTLTFIQLLSVLGSLSICIVNTILSLMIKKLTSYEKHSTKTSFSTARAGKEAIVLLINIAFTSLFVEFILAEDFSLSSNFFENVHTLNIYGEDGLVSNMFYVFLTDCLYVPIFKLLDFEHFLKRLMQKRVLKQGEDAVMTQGSANILFESPQVDMSNNYALIIKTMLLTSFYAPALPLTILLSAVGIVLAYWSDKYLFLRRNPLPSALNSELNASMINYLEWMPFIFALGNCMFMATLVQSNGQLAFNDENEALVFSTLIFGIVSVVIPTRSLNTLLFRIKGESVENIPFNEAKPYFNTDYEMQNPITRHQVVLNLPYKLA